MAKVELPISQQVAPTALTPTPEQLKEQRFQTFSREWLSTTIYKAELPENFPALFWDAFRHFSAAGLKIHHNLYDAMLEATEYSYAQFDIIMQIFSMVNGAQMDMDKDEYIDFQKACRIMGETFLNAIDAAKGTMRKEFDEIESVIDTTAEVGQA